MKNKISLTSIIAAIIFMLTACGSVEGGSAAPATGADAAEATEAAVEEGAALEDAIPLKDGKPADGEYYVNLTLEGGTGKAGLSSPAELDVKDGVMQLHLKWSSPYYDYMYIPAQGDIASDDVLYKPVNEDGNSEFILPVFALDTPIKVVADTTAMSTPHEIEYTITLSSASLGTTKEEAESKSASAGEVNITQNNAGDTADTGTVQNGSNNSNNAASAGVSYAGYFDIEPCSESTRLITIADTNKYLLAEAGAAIPKDISKDTVILQKPFNSIYLAASAPMDFFNKLGGLDKVKMTSTQAENWNLPDIKTQVERGDIIYVGKYSTPDFEAVVGNGCDLCVESTMIYHKPETKEKLESLGIPVLVDYSSYESDPLGRLEWIKLYGMLMDKEEEADKYFEENVSKVNAVSDGTEYGRTVAFFYVTGNGRVSVKKSNDYVVKMIKMAGGDYAFDNLAADDTGAQSTVNMTMEEFYATARDADILIYNSAIDNPLNSLKELEDKSSLFSSFKAFKNGEVWCTEKDMYQEITGVTGTIEDLKAIISGQASDADELKYMHRLK